MRLRVVVPSAATSRTFGERTRPCSGFSREAVGPHAADNGAQVVLVVVFCLALRTSAKLLDELGEARLQRDPSFRDFAIGDPSNPVDFNLDLLAGRRNAHEWPVVRLLGTHSGRDSIAFSHEVQNRPLLIGKCRHHNSTERYEGVAV